MASYGYGSVTAKAFIAFEVDLGDGEWASLDEAPHSLVGGAVKSSVLAAGLPAWWKLRLTTGIAALKVAVGSEVLTALDTAWDSVQRRLHYDLMSLSEDPDPNINAAATRLRSLLLAGAGSAQTGLDYDAEVDFGRQQAALAKEPKAAVDVALLHLEPRLAEAAGATERLATALGRRSGQGRQAPPSVLLREAVAACARDFSAVHEDLSWLLDHLERGPDRERLRVMKAPLEALLARSSASAGKVAAAAPEAAAPVEEVESQGT